MKMTKEIRDNIVKGKMISAADCELLYKENIDSISKSKAESLYHDLLIRIEEGERNAGIEVKKTIFDNKQFQAKIEQFRENGFNVKARGLQNGKMFVVVSF